VPIGLVPGLTRTSPLGRSSPTEHRRPGCGFDVVELESERTLVLRSNSHLPMSWRDRAVLDWTWVFVLTPVEDGRRTRFHFRSRWVSHPWWFTLSGWLGVVPADFVMSPGMLRGVKQRAENPASVACARSPIAVALITER
jgi:hypothetical protein